MKILAIIQARASSSRLPRKVLAPILGSPMLARMLERVQRSRLIDEVVVATSDDTSDNELEVLCNQIGVACYRGSLDNVLQRFYGAVGEYGADHVVRLTGDCPLIDPDVIDNTIRFYLDEGFDYASNTSPPMFPDGLDVEVFSVKALVKAVGTAEKSSELEHVTPFLRNHKELFKLGGYRADMDRSNLRWTVDEPEDLEFVRAVYDALYEAISSKVTSRYIRPRVLVCAEGGGEERWIVGCVEPGHASDPPSSPHQSPSSVNILITTLSPSVTDALEGEIFLAKT